MTVWIAAAIFVSAAVLWKLLPSGRGRFRSALVFVTLWLICWSIPFTTLQTIALSLLEVAALQVLAGLLFDVAVLRVQMPRFVIEMGVVVGYITILFNLLFSLGVNVTGIFATSAVATAVVGLALQDMLSNIAGGIALELERGLRVGDFVKVGESAGWVKFVRLRSTVIETPDGDRIVLPNSFLTRSAFTVIPRVRRRFIPFHMPYSCNPQELMDAVTVALRTSPVPGIAEAPQPFCIIQEMTPGHINYAAVVWMLEPGRDNIATSSVFNRIYFALQRAGIPATEITHLLEMRQVADGRAALSDPVHVLRNTPIFRLMEDAGLVELGAQLHPLSFAPGELIIRQGDSGDSMYFVTSGQVRINFADSDGMEREVATIGPGDFFGEASLLTGETRNASAIATSRVDCYRLEKAGLQGILDKWPDLAEDISVVIAHRQMELAVVRNILDEETARLREAENQTQLLARIRRFFSIK